VVGAALEPERDERRWRKREAAKQEVLRRLERLTIGGEALGDAEIRRRRERRRKRLQALAKALERSSQEGNGGAFEVYGQLKSTEEALKKMARKAKQLEAEATDLQVRVKRSARTRLPSLASPKKVRCNPDQSLTYAKSLPGLSNGHQCHRRIM
jgi:hypothetical protein